ncbi:LpxL/LpxP family Kdo(2)-lipid IV(A) lauroyl/palmitoleoyl acyltransferase [Marinobacter sp. NP-4(2019)]|uniref:LpxL/LpxP family Kdo(2)-lipid IV(A) lauroyl/palmitoleoyl acyltransferase n=1 Tax=Marinobacter sp. NP-4(2019) TaxID=2488665 RepID=UPI000FC3D1C2|nr:LpxL/LpxP family Kdo(2)-lipid IV(A) lauroyl/palmitoleoyl acyltransferase [Marinobacter sp. NP-4(2019)]AZT82818.1 LpxL/LpxP family Kdo(2)-lipid IV(A) lauroyl/palmitoleoyl acyltransferase [Marinobacter sp. NP-4(2019)]
MSKRPSQKRDTRYTSYCHPRWWPTWLGIALMWLMSRLPLNLQWRIGKLIGELAYRLIPRRRHITEVNIRLCFPELSRREQQQLVRKAFHSNGIGIMEIGLAWFRDPKAFLPLTAVHGLEHVDAALEKGRGILLLGGHYSTLDLGGSLVTEFIEADVMQRDHNNPLMNAVMTRARERRYGVALDSKNLRGLLKQLKQNRIVWYATDQDYGRKGIVFAPFFGVPAGSITATSRIAERSGCAVVPFSHFRRENQPGYDIYFHPPLENFPSGDDLADATLVNHTIEQEVRRYPDQYLWMHRRFKTRPSKDDPDLYRKDPH